MREEVEPGVYGVVWYLMLNGDGFVEIDWGTDRWCNGPGNNYEMAMDDDVLLDGALDPTTW